MVAALTARFVKHMRASPAFCIAALLDPFTFVQDSFKDWVLDSAMWAELEELHLDECVEEEIVRIASALGFATDAARREWQRFLSGRMSPAWNAELALCAAEAVPVERWLLWVKTADEKFPPAAVDEKSLRPRLKIWERMGKAVESKKDGKAHDGFPILSAIALRVLTMHPSSCSVERNWSAWKRLSKAERSSMTFDHVQQRIQIAEYYNGH